MARDSRDPKGYYAVLNLSPGASEPEVRLAYTFLKDAWRTNRKLDRAKIKEAYETLSDSQLRREYLSVPRKKTVAPGNRVYVLGGSSVVILLLIAGFIFPGFLLPGPDSFSAGDRLLNAQTMAPLGEILRYESDHVFPNGGIGDAYLVRLEEESERWFPAGDLEQHYRKP